MATEKDNIWAAGVIDGGGSIGIDNYKAGKGSWTMRLSVSKTTSGDGPPIVLERLHGLYGGVLKPFRKTDTSHTRDGSTRWAWRIFTTEAQAFLEAIEPYVCQRKEAVRLALEYRHQIVGNDRVAEIPAYAERLKKAMRR